MLCGTYDEENEPDRIEHIDTHHLQNLTTTEQNKNAPVTDENERKT